MKKTLFLQLIISLLVLTSNQIIYAQYKFEWKRKNLGSGASIRGLCVVNEDIIWLSGNGGTVAKSVDKGTTWQLLSVEGGAELDFRDVQAFDENTAVIMSSGPGNKSKVFKTIDGGLTWELVHLNTDKDGFFNGIAFWDDQNGILAGDPLENHLYIATTNDGGNTWKKVHKSKIPEINDEEYGFAASGTHLTVYDGGQTWIGTGGKTARVFYSADWGETWKVADTPINQGKGSQGIFSIKFLDHSFGLAVGGDYNKPSDTHNNVILTKDKGETWSLIADYMEFRSCVDYVDGFFIAVGSSSSSYSHDKGASWHPIGVMGFNTLNIGGNKEAIWAAGDDGKIAHLNITQTH